MSIITLPFLKSLSFKGARDLLLQEGYVEETVIEKHSPACDRQYLYPYVLYSSDGEILDTIFYVECCNRVIDEEYADGRMTWEPIATNWAKTC